MKKKLTTIITMLLTIGLLTTSAFAAPSDFNSSKIDITKNDLVELSPEQVPEGIVPVEFDTWEDALKYLENREASIKAEEQLYEKINREKRIIPMKPSKNIITRASTGTQTKAVGKEFLATYKMSVRYTYEYSSSANRNIFKGCQSITTGLYGINMDTTCNQTDSWYSITDRGRTLVANSKVNYKIYLLIQGGVQLYSGHRQFQANFYA